MSFVKDRISKQKKPVIRSYHKHPWKNRSLKNIPYERWKDIPGFEGIYKASNLGRIKKTRTVIRRVFWWAINEEYIVAQTINPWGYVYVELANFKKRRKKFFVHVLIARTWKNNPKNKPCVNHKKGIKHDNRASELEWNTRSENSLHAHRTGLAKGVKSFLGRKYEKCPHSIPIDQYSMDGEFLRRWSSQIEAADVLGLSSGNIWSAMNGVYKQTGGFKWKYAN